MKTVAIDDLHAPAFERIIASVQKNNAGPDCTLVRRAYAIAREAHAGQRRLTGEDYIVHPLAVAQYLADRRFLCPTIAAALLHDVLEDTNVTEEFLRGAIGDEVTELVIGVSVLDTIKYRGVERYIENLRKMFVAMAKDLRVIIIKLADRIDNLKTLYVFPKEKRLRLARDSMEILAPIAYRLCLNDLRGDLEDLAFQYLEPKEYTWTTNILRSVYPAREQYLEQVRVTVEEEFKKMNVVIVGVFGRAKRIYSLHQKLLRFDRDISRIHDLVAMRIVVKTVPECYAALGIIHQLWKPLKGRVKDYIAHPKPNGYQSLHTSVFCEGGEVVEFQIRTEAMHDIAEFGVAGHWRIGRTSAKKPSFETIKQEHDWILELTKWSRERNEKERELSDRKLDVFQKRIFIFTPKGEVLDLPLGATPVDYAYAIHSTLGMQCTMALVNNEKKPLDRELHTGDGGKRIEKKKKKRPSPEWLKFVKTNRARQHIREQLKGSVFAWRERVAAATTRAIKSR